MWRRHNSRHRELESSFTRIIWTALRRAILHDTEMNCRLVIMVITRLFSKVWTPKNTKMSFGQHLEIIKANLAKFENYMVDS